MRVLANQRATNVPPRSFVQQEPPNIPSLVVNRVIFVWKEQRMGMNILAFLERTIQVPILNLVVPVYLPPQALMLIRWLKLKRLVFVTLDFIAFQDPFQVHLQMVLRETNVYQACYVPKDQLPPQSVLLDFTVTILSRG